MIERYKLHKATQDLLDYLDEATVLDRDKVMTLVHQINHAYIGYADMVDTAKVWG